MSWRSRNDAFSLAGAWLAPLRARVRQPERHPPRANGGWRSTRPLVPGRFTERALRLDAHLGAPRRLRRIRLSSDRRGIKAFPGARPRGPGKDRPGGVLLPRLRGIAL